MSIATHVGMRSAVPCLIAGGALLGFMFTASAANAGVVIAGDLDYAAPISSTDNSGAGFAIRFGYQVQAPFSLITPELVFSYDAFSGGLQSKVYRGLGGVRLGLDDTVRSGAYLHLGFGHIKPDAPDLSHDDLSYDLGVFLDLAILSKLTVGGHLAYNRVTGGPNALQWATAGVNVGVTF